MVKKGMGRPEQGKAIIAGTMGAERKVWHEPSLTNAHGPLGNDLALDNLENDLPLAELQDLQ